MDISPQNSTQQPISDDQDLAKALAGVLPDDPTPESTATDDTLPELPIMQFSETPSGVEEPVVTDNPVLPPLEVPTAVPEPTVEPTAMPTVAQPASELDDIKKDALTELRPLIDKVTLPADEKFNTYLMLIRSTDDASLIGPAHTAAQAIEDEAVRAQALLDIIKEIDYLTHNAA